MMMEPGQETGCGAMDRVGGCSDASRHDVLSSAFLLHNVRESLTRKGQLLGEAAHASAAAAPAADPENVHPSPIIPEADATHRNVSWILARKNSRKRNKQPRCSLDLNESSFVHVEMLSSKDIENFLLEGARIGALLGQAEKSCTPDKRNLGMAKCSPETTARTQGCDPSRTPEAATDRAMDPLTPEIEHQSCRRRSPGSSAEYNSSPEPTDPGDLLSNDRGATCRTPAMPAKEQEETTTSSPSECPSRGARPRAQEQVTKQEVQENASAADKATRKRKYMPKIRAENPKPRNRATRARAASPPVAIIPETTSSPSLLQMKSFARTNQRRSKRSRRGKATAAMSKDSPATSAAPGDSVTPRTLGEPAVQDAISQSAEFLRFLHEDLFAHHATKLDRASSRCPADRVDSNCESPVVDVNRSTAAEGPPSPPRGQAVAFLSTCLDFTLVMPPWSPPSPASDVAELWNNFDSEMANSRVAAATSVRRTLKFDADEKLLPQAHQQQPEDTVVDLQPKDWPQRAAAHDDGVEYVELLPTVPAAAAHEVSVPQVVAMDPAAAAAATSGPREKELQIVAYDEGSKRIVLYRRRGARVRRVRYKPKVNLDARTVQMFKTLTIKAAAAAAGMEADEQKAEAVHEKASWDRARQAWQHRAHHFISIMRQVQGNRSFSRWKGSVVDSVGGAFLTQNVSDFLSSNAFIALRARFPARPLDANTTEATSTSLRKDQPRSVEERQHSIIPAEASIPCPADSRPTPLNHQHRGDQQRQESEASTCLTSPAEVLYSNADTTSACVEHSLSDFDELLSLTGLNEHCGIGKRGIFQARENSRSSEDAQARECIKASQGITVTERGPSQHLTTGSECESGPAALGFKKSNPSGIDALELCQASTIHHPDRQTVSSSDEPVNYYCNNNSDRNESSELQEVMLQPELEPELESPACEWAWKVKLAAAGVIQEKFSSVVTENVSSLTVVGKEKVLAATLRGVLGKKHTTRELQQGQVHVADCSSSSSSSISKLLALKTLKLRPARAILRSNTDNYRYRHSVSFKLLSGEARANWEAGFVMKSQKAKWEPLRAAIVEDEHYCRDPLTADCVDWHAVQQASVHEVAEVIKNRGMNNALAGRMKAFLDRVHRDQNGSIDLEWIRQLPPEDAKAFLLSFRGVGIKSVECIRLLTLHHPSFPVDTNVGRILVRLGWVPLEPLPEETQLHLLELYPIQSQIQQYAWPRLCTLDQKTLYELHYQMITFGKVFCTKSKPNCNACPMRTECKHYASSYASAKLLLKGPKDDKEGQAATTLALQGTDPTTEPAESTQVHSCMKHPCIPIIEEPRSPEPNTTTDIIPSIPDIEELALDFDCGTGMSVHTVTHWPPRLEAGSLVTGELCINNNNNNNNADVERTRLLDLNREPEPETCVLPVTLTADVGKRGVDLVSMKTVPTMRPHYNNLDNTQEAALENIIPLETTVEDDVQMLRGGVPADFQHLPSQELILLPPQASLAPAPKLKSIQRLRTVHFVYELPDHHPLLFEMDKRVADDPCFYLLAIWSPDEVPATMPKINDDESRNPFASCEEGCNVDPEQTTVRGTLLIPCKTAMRGWFPLNGTYFQVNEVFADHASSVQPIDVPRTLLWSLRRRFVYFSTAVSNLFKDMSQEEIQCCFQKGYVCLRAFDVTTRQPKILAPRLHQSGAKIVKAPAPRKDRGPRRRKTPPTEKPQTKTPEFNSPSEDAMSH